VAAEDRFEPGTQITWSGSEKTTIRLVAGWKARWFTFVAKDAMDLWLLDLFSENRSSLTNAGAVNVEPRCQPDRKLNCFRFYFAQQRDFIFSVANVNDETRQRVRLTGETKSDLPRYSYSHFDYVLSPCGRADVKEFFLSRIADTLHVPAAFGECARHPGADA